MKVDYLKRLPQFLVGVLLVLGMSLPAYAADITTRPYFKVYGGDVSSGGWFGNSGCTTSNYQDPLYTGSSGNDSRNGGILTYANQSASNPANSAGGASGQYGVFALGQVDNTAASDGFYSDSALSSATSTGKSLLTFANTTGGWGGLFELGTGSGNSYAGLRQNSCVPDYYSRMPSTATVKTTSDTLGSYLNTSDNYSVTVPSGNIYDLTGGTNLTVNAGTHTTLYVSGNVYIGSNITYSLDTATDVPKFALVVKGSIYIAPNVTELDGFYVAQPATNNASTVDADDGDIWTCHPNNTNQLDYRYVADNCQAQLVINGALAAKQVNLMRVKGDVANAPTNGSEDSVSGGTASSNIAEIINYTPEMAIGGSFFSSTNSSSAGLLPIDSVLSLPPAF